MKIFQINTVCGFGSTGSICMDIAVSLEKAGHECYIAYGQRYSTYKRSYRFGYRWENYIHSGCSRVFGNQGVYSIFGTKQLIRYIKDVQPDVIHLHNLHGNYLNLKILFNFLSKADIPVVWTLHDCWAFTGKCAYYIDVNCNKWKSECKKCPLLKNYPPSIFDRSKSQFYLKKYLFNSVSRMMLLPVSDWLKGEVEQSFLKNIPCTRIYNWIDRNIFYPRNKDIKTKYRLPVDKDIILSVSAEWLPGTTRYQDALELAKILPENFQLMLVGRLDNKATLPDNIIHVPYITNVEELAMLYSEAFAYVHFSIKDTFGKVIAEAMACGTPVIVYNSTACPEVIAENCGYAVELHDIDSIKKCINLIKENGKAFYSENCINRVAANFDYKINIDRIISIYNDLLK